MAKIFTLTIPYFGEKLPALVSIRDNCTDLTCQVKFLKDSERLLPGGMLRFQLGSGFSLNIEAAPEGSDMLIQSTAQAIFEYLSEGRPAPR